MATSEKVLDIKRLSNAEKEANDKQWYKDRIKELNTVSLSRVGFGGISERQRIKVNCDLFNNHLDINELAYVCTPYGGTDAGNLPAAIVNRDITSYRIKALLGMEMKRPFPFRVIAVNKEATTRREEQESQMIRQYVVDQIMLPIRQQAEIQYQEQLNQEGLTQEQTNEIRKQIESEIDSKTPDQVRKYMQRDHQDPAEMLGHQISEYLLRKEEVKRKFNNGWKYAVLTGYEIYWIGISHNKPVMKVVNPYRFTCDTSEDIEFIEDGKWAVAEYQMNPSTVSEFFDLTDDEAERLISINGSNVISLVEKNLREFNTTPYYNTNEMNTIRVVHAQWKAPKKIGWLTYINDEGEIIPKYLVPEDYKMNKEAGDIKIDYEWIEETYEGYQLGADIFKNLGPVVGQNKDIHNIYKSKLSFYGAMYDNTNSNPTAPMDRMKYDQYLYNIVMFRIEMLMASDKGKKILMNINAIPESAGISVTQWQHFFETSPFMFYNPEEEGMTNQDVNTIAKVLDLSLVSKINEYIQIAEFLDRRCGQTVGVTDPVLGQTSVSESVGNNQQNLIQTSHILEPYFNLHNVVKERVLNALLDVAKIAYVNDENDVVLDYILDDLSRQTLKVDKSLLLNSSLGIFFEQSIDAQEIRETIKQLAHAYAQNQAIELSDVIGVLKETSPQGAEEILKIAEDKKFAKSNQAAEQERQFKASEEQKKRDHDELQHERAKEIITLKAKEDRLTKTALQAMLSVGFNENKDMDNDGQLDVLEIANQGVDTNIKMMEQNRLNRELDHKIEDAKEKNKIAKEKLTIDKMKKNK